jgi:hypothetical protein
MVGVEHLEDEAAGADAELEDCHLGGRRRVVAGLPLAVEAHDDATAGVGGADAANPLIGDGGVAGDRGVDLGGAEADGVSCGGHLALN